MNEKDLERNSLYSIEFLPRNVCGGRKNIEISGWTWQMAWLKFEPDRPVTLPSWSIGSFFQWIVLLRWEIFKGNKIWISSDVNASSGVLFCGGRLLQIFQRNCWHHFQGRSSKWSGLGHATREKGNKSGPRTMKAAKRKIIKLIIVYLNRTSV